jgi:histidine triad (HIT) family protein
MSDKEITEEDLKNMSAEEVTELQKQSCIFCKIVEKQIPSKIVHQNSNNICILDINPASEGHMLVYPKKHYMILPHLPEDELFSLFKDVRLMSRTLLQALQCKGTTIFIANGSAAGQRAPHVLVHVFPRRENDELIKLPTYEMNDEQVEKLRKELGHYVHQVFGPGIRNITSGNVIKKDADKNNIIPDQDKKSNSAKIPHTHSDKHIHTHVKKKDVDEKKKKSKPETDENKKTSGGKIDLDDIARLFGG